MSLKGYKYLETVPGRRGGRVTIKGTRVTVEDILEALAAGWTVDEVSEQFNLPKEAVLEAIKYAANLMRRVEVLRVAAPSG